MPTITITLTDAGARRVATLAAAADQPVEAFVERVLRQLAETDVDLDQGLPVLRIPPGAPRLTSAEVDRLLNGDEG